MSDRTEALCQICLKNDDEPNLCYMDGRYWKCKRKDFSDTNRKKENEYNNMIKSLGDTELFD